MTLCRLVYSQVYNGQSVTLMRLEKSNDLGGHKWVVRLNEAEWEEREIIAKTANLSVTDSHKGAGAAVSDVEAKWRKAEEFVRMKAAREGSEEAVMRRKVADAQAAAATTNAVADIVRNQKKKRENAFRELVELGFTDSNKSTMLLEELHWDIDKVIDRLTSDSAAVTPTEKFIISGPTRSRGDKVTLCGLHSIQAEYNGHTATLMKSNDDAFERWIVCLDAPEFKEKELFVRSIICRRHSSPGVSICAFVLVKRVKIVKQVKQVKQLKQLKQVKQVTQKQKSTDTLSPASDFWEYANLMPLMTAIQRPQVAACPASLLKSIRVCMQRLRTGKLRKRRPTFAEMENSRLLQEPFLRICLHIFSSNTSGIKSQQRERRGTNKQKRRRMTTMRRKSLCSASL